MIENETVIFVHPLTVHHLSYVIDGAFHVLAPTANKKANQNPEF